MDLSFGGTQSFRGTQNIITLIHYYFNYFTDHFMTRLKNLISKTDLKAL